MITRRTKLLWLFLSILVASPYGIATSTESAAIVVKQRPAPYVSQGKTAVPFSATYEHYGPQATARAVRASIKAALSPDPLAMAALLFLAFALRWIKTQRQEGQPAQAVEGSMAQQAA